MPSKDVFKRREAIRRHYNANKAYYIEKALKRRAELRQWVYDLKNSTPCTDCGVLYPYYITDFDRTGERGVKVNTVSKIINTGNFEKLKLEIAKCDLVCSNCHRFRTYRRNKDNQV